MRKEKVHNLRALPSSIPWAGHVVHLGRGDQILPKKKTGVTSGL
jgi:hypothetical protein